MHANSAKKRLRLSVVKSGNKLVTEKQSLYSYFTCSFCEMHLMGGIILICDVKIQGSGSPKEVGSG